MFVFVLYYLFLDFLGIFWELKYCVLFFQIGDDVLIIKVNTWFFYFIVSFEMI